MNKCPDVNGIALILVLWILSLLTIIAIGMTTTLRTETVLAANQLNNARFRNLTEAGIQFAALNLLTPASMDADQDTESPKLWLPDGKNHTWSLGGEVLDIRIINETSLIDLNSAERSLLVSLMNAAGLKDRDVDSLVDAILDWRDEDNLHLANGAEDADYAAAGRPYGAKDAPFDSVEELRQVLGFDRSIYELLAPALTVSSALPTPQIDFAPDLVRAAVEGISLEELQNRLEEEAAVLNRPLQPRGRGGPLYRIQVRWQGPNGTTRTMEALARIQMGMVPPVTILYRHYAIT